MKPSGRNVSTAPTALIETAIRVDQEAQMLGYEGLEEFCNEMLDRAAAERRSPTLRVLLAAYLVDHPKKSVSTAWTWLERKFTPGLWDHRVGTMDIDFWRDEISAADKRNKWAPKTHNTAVKMLRSLYVHAIANGKVTKNPITAIRVKSLEAREVAILQPEQLRELLVRCLREDRPMGLYFAVLCFAGLRPTGEFESDNGITWEDVRWAQGILAIRDKKNAGKTGAVMRYVTLNTTLLSWLTAYKEDKGRICPVNYRKRRTHLIRRPDGTLIAEWSLANRDLTRHSFGSYLAPTVSTDEVMKEMGHTTIKTFQKHYRNTRSKEQAAEYWGLTYESITSLVDFAG
jgi:integrase